MISSPRRRATSSKRRRRSSAVSIGASGADGKPVFFLSQGSGSNCRGVTFFFKCGWIMIAAKVRALSHSACSCCSLISVQDLQMLSNSSKYNRRNSSVERPMHPTAMPRRSKMPVVFFFQRRCLLLFRRSLLLTVSIPPSLPGSQGPRIP